MRALTMFLVGVQWTTRILSVKIRVLRSVLVSVIPYRTTAPTTNPFDLDEPIHVQSRTSPEAVRDLQILLFIQPITVSGSLECSALGPPSQIPLALF
ncbi:hypothetical protein PF005_g20680 [Phytophthora fragariae]|uniref:Secreted protein n=1 Tax=Phytophthora fragariae TaxID=53985 RepID=A0A6A3QZ41_9STRA|nr:hypothetical protein PF003_g38896 [Phytophthora fragariae]KAE8928174.1 hypothetical protein PF009_g21673 [Phytophthora fragariae]KAE8987614.1 hypothetical protein PF011_g19506 [Phytophthora fragariae]KAE9086384.1 hypothetical protein PF010_g20105 [Phytophthora fragariae]KAE9086567.1 hypothetical protein PF007_g20727 [Phytophthora fragariae]